jgi:tetratricopeptide (TPR) repeat protein
VAGATAALVLAGVAGAVLLRAGRGQQTAAPSAAPEATASAPADPAPQPASAASPVPEGARRPPDAPEQPEGSPAKRPRESAPAHAGQALDVARVGRKPGESTDAWHARAAAIQMRYGYSKAALERGDYAAAAGGFEAILLDEPGYLDAPQLLVEAQSGLRGSARNLFRAGTKLDAAGDWVGALQKYEQARQIYAGVPGLTDSLQRVRERLHAAGTSAFNHARQLEASGHAQDAVKEYEKAMQWLPPDDPNRHFAQARIEQLRRN